MVDIKSAGGYLISKLFSGSSVFVLLPCGAQVQQLSAQIQILQQKVKVKNCQESVKKLLIQIKNIFYRASTLDFLIDVQFKINKYFDEIQILR